MIMEKQNKKVITNMGTSLSSLTRNTAFSRAQILKNALIKVTGNTLFAKKLIKQDSEKN